MLILTGTTHSPARASQGLATIAVPAAAAPEPFKFAPEVPGNLLLEALGLDGLTKEETKAVLKPINAAISAISPAGKGLVKGIDLWQSSEKALTLFQDGGTSSFKRLDATIEAAGSLAAVVKVCAPSVNGLAAFRILDDALSVSAVICKVYKEATKEPEPPFRYRILR